MYYIRSISYNIIKVTSNLYVPHKTIYIQLVVQMSMRIMRDFDYISGKISGNFIINSLCVISGCPLTLLKTCFTVCWCLLQIVAGG